MVIHNLKTGIHFLHFALDGEGTSVQSSCMIATLGHWITLVGKLKSPRRRIVGAGE